MAYTKLDANIIYSTVWKERPEVVKVWFTLMALADRDGYIGASSEGIARAALVSEEITETALALFSSPDPKSRTKDWEGRRLIEVDGGWRLLNHAKYRDAQSAEEKREAAAKRQREYMERKRAKETQDREALAAASGASVRNSSLLTRNDRNDRNDPSDHAQAQINSEKIGERPPADISPQTSPVPSPRESEREPNIETEAAPAVEAVGEAGEFGVFDEQASWDITREVWGNAGRHPEEFNLTTARKAFLKHINAGNWKDFSERLNWAVGASLARGDRTYLGFLYTFIVERWQDQERPFNPATATSPDDDAPPVY